MANLKNEVTSDQIDHILSDCELYEKKGVTRNISQFARNAFVSTGVASQIVNLYDFVRINDFSAIAEYIKKYECSKKYLKYIIEKQGISYEDYMSKVRWNSTSTDDEIQIAVKHIPIIMNSYETKELKISELKEMLLEQCRCSSTAMFVAINRLEKAGTVKYNKETGTVNFLKYPLPFIDCVLPLSEFPNFSKLNTLEEVLKDLSFNIARFSSTNDNTELINILTTISNKVASDNLLITACFHLTHISHMLHDICAELIPNYEIKVKNREEMLKHDKEEVIKALDETAKVYMQRLKDEQKEGNDNVK